MLSMIEAIIIIVTVLILALLFLPVNIFINSTGSERKIDGSFIINWMMFQFSYLLKEKRTEIFFFGRRILSRESRQKKRKEQKEKIMLKKTLKITSFSNIFELKGPILKFFKGLVNAFRLKHLDIDVTYGLDDPAYTGIMTGFLYALPFRIGNKINIEPNFTGQVFDWNLKANASIRPIRIIPLLARLATDRNIIRAGWRSIRE